MKKFLIVALAPLFGVILFASCKKDSPVPQPSIVGFWKGKIGIGQQYPIYGYAYLFRDNGTVRVYFLGNNSDTTLAKVAEGSYLLTGTQLNTTHTYFPNGSQHSTVGIINGNYSFTEGTWASIQNPNHNGKFFLNKQ
jgi:hypothetical protein